MPADLPDGCTDAMLDRATGNWRERDEWAMADLELEYLKNDELLGRVNDRK